MKYVLDTNACIRFLNGSSAALVARLRSQHPADIAMCSIVRAELLYGAMKSARRADNLRLLDRFFEPYASVAIDDMAAAHYGSIRAHLEQGGRPIGPNDLLIAACARAHDLTLITHNVREFSRVPELVVDDWEIEDPEPPPGL